MSMRSFAIQVSGGEPISHLVLAGDLHFDTVGALDEAYEGAASRRSAHNVVLYLSDLLACDLHGQRALRRCHGAGAGLVGAPACVQRSFERAGLAHLLPSGNDVPWPAVMTIGPCAPHV